MNKLKIKSIQALEVLDSRGQPTVSATVSLENGLSGCAKVPSGASTGSHEAMELRDRDPQRYRGLGVQTALKNIREIIQPALVGRNPEDQAELDKIMLSLDGTDNKARLGANAILAVSLALAQAAAHGQRQPLYEYLTKFNPDFNGKYQLPVPMMNVLNGGRHANWATDIQEYLILPIGLKTITEAIRAGAEIYQALKVVLRERGYSLLVGDEGGFAPVVKSNIETFELLSAAVASAGYHLGQDIVFGIDAAATEFYQDGVYHLKKEGRQLSSAALSLFYEDLRQQFPIRSWEDIFSEDDWPAFQQFTARHKTSDQIVGDDLYVTDTRRLARGIKEKATNSILIKLNQVGTVSETVQAILAARQAGFSAVVSNRSGETEDTFIADFTVAMGTGQIKTGAPARAERTAKYNRLLEIAAALGDQATYMPFPFK